MARQPRIDIADIPQHVIQRGNNRQNCFHSNDDRRQYINWLQQATEKCGAYVHAYVLMSNHVHLLVTGAEVGAVGRMMQSLGRRYVRYFNSRYHRTGTLWEGRYKSSLVDSDCYLLTCYRYIELNPVRAGIVKTPYEYRWSSFGHNALGSRDSLITQHATYGALGKSNKKRQLAYRRLFQKDIDDNEIQAIRHHVNQGKVLGSKAFADRIEALLDRRVRLAKPGRPKNV